MYLENIVMDSLDPQRLGRFWEAAVGGETLTAQHDAFETRYTFGDTFLDLCFQPVSDAPTPSPRLHLDLTGGAEQHPVVDRLLALCATHLDIGQGDVPWVVLADQEGTPFCVMHEHTSYDADGAIASLPLDSSDVARDLGFWSWLTGWVPDEREPDGLRHPSWRGPVLEICAEPRPKEVAKNRLHLDLRLEPDDDVDAIAGGIKQRGGAEFHPGWGELPWRHFVDPSGNEFCLLFAR